MRSPSSNLKDGHPSMHRTPLVEKLALSGRAIFLVCDFFDNSFFVFDSICKMMTKGESFMENGEVLMEISYM